MGYALKSPSFLKEMSELFQVYIKGKFDLLQFDHYFLLSQRSFVVFKRIFINESINGKLPRIIFEECGFNIDIIGMQRIKSSASRWRTAFKNGGAIKLTDTRKYNTGRPIEKDLSIEEKYKKLEAKMKLLQAENELLKKLDMIERRVLKKK